MCGFAGLCHNDSSKPVDSAELASMIATIGYRGPDGEGFHTEPGVGFGFRRLAIIDPEGGHQPLSNEDGTVWIVFNGEIYNYRALAHELAQRGHTFRTRSDTETIVHAYEEWGDACVERLRGIFAFAIWDRPKRRLFLARDRSGIKPLNLAFTADGILFASEAKALLATGRLPRRLDLIGYLGGEETNPALERTAFHGIQQLGAGCTLSFSQGSHRASRYWSYEPSDAAEGIRDGAVEQFRELLHEIVGMQLVSDVPVAASLSGGIDSSAVVASMVRHGRDDIRTYTVAFENDHTKDLINARVVAKHLGVRHTEVPCSISRSSIERLSEIAWIAEGEFDLGYLARYELARAVYSDGAKVLLTGQGIDEILTGYYPSYEHFRRLNLIRTLQQRLRPSYRGIPMFSMRAIDESGDELCALAEDWARLSAEQLKSEHSRLSNGLLRFEDRMGMAGHVEVRVPFLDHLLLEFCAATSEAEREKLFHRKSILRQAAEPWLPPSIVNRPKVGFNASALPISRLVATAGEGSAIAHLLGREATEQKGYFDPAYRDQIFAVGDSMAMDHLFILHLLDEVFVRSFGFESIARQDADRPWVIDTAPRRTATAITSESIPALSSSVVRIRATWPVDPSRRIATDPDRAEIEFAEPMRGAAIVSAAKLSLLELIDGVKSYRELAVNPSTSENDLVTLGVELESAGIIEHTDRPSRGASQAPESRGREDS